MIFSPSIFRLSKIRCHLFHISNYPIPILLAFLFLTITKNWFCKNAILIRWLRGRTNVLEHLSWSIPAIAETIPRDAVAIHQGDRRPKVNRVSARRKRILVGTFGWIWILSCDRLTGVKEETRPNWKESLWASLGTQKPNQRFRYVSTRCLSFCFYPRSFSLPFILYPFASILRQTDHDFFIYNMVHY